MVSQILSSGDIPRAAHHAKSGLEIAERTGPSEELASALVIHVLYPLAPPRKYADLGFVDTARLLGPNSYGKGNVFGGVANQFAAMPSLHFGWAVLVAWGVIHYTRRRVRWLAVLHPTLTLAAVVLPMAIVTLTRGLNGRYSRHRSIARWTFPIWMYVSVTGVLVYVLLYQPTWLL